MTIRPCEGNSSCIPTISPTCRAELSVASPLGTALLGLRVGDRMPFRIDDAGIQHVVAVVGIGRRFSDEPVRGRGAPAPREA